MAMAAVEAMQCGGPAGGWKRQLIVSWRTSRGGSLGFVRAKRRPLVDAEVLSSSATFGAGRFATASRHGERIKLVVLLTTNDRGTWIRNWSPGEMWNREIEERCGDQVFQRQYGEVDNTVYARNSQDGSSLFREYGAGQQGNLGSTSREEFTTRSRRRAFFTSCLFALATFSFIGETGEAQAEDIPAKPEKKKGRAPSSPYDEDRVLEQNRRMQRLNNAPTEFPGFIREGFQVKVITNGQYVTSKSGLIYYDMVIGNGDLPQDGQQVIFHYTGYNESGRRVDSSYQQGRPARTRVGIQGMIPGFEEGIKTMRPGGRRIIIVPPELGPPVGPSTFFSAKQFEVFDVELLEAKDCSRRTLLFYSDVVCE